MPVGLTGISPRRFDKGTSRALLQSFVRIGEFSALDGVRSWRMNDFKGRRKLPRQGDSSKVEFLADCCLASTGVMSPSESCGRSSLYSSIHQ